MEEQTIRDVLVAAVQSANGHGVKAAITDAAQGLVEAQRMFTASLPKATEIPFNTLGEPWGGKVERNE